MLQRPAPFPKLGLCFRIRENTTLSEWGTRTCRGSATAVPAAFEWRADAIRVWRFAARVPAGRRRELRSRTQNSLFRRGDHAERPRMNSAIIVAAGRRTRMDLTWTSSSCLWRAGPWWPARERFDRHPDIHEVVVVVRAGMESAFAELAELHGFRKPHRFSSLGRRAPGFRRPRTGGHRLLGTTSSPSGWCPPCTAPAVISRCLAAAQQAGAAVAALTGHGHAQESDGGATACSASGSRSGSGRCRPQCFRRKSSNARWRPSGSPDARSPTTPPPAS